MTGRAERRVRAVVLGASAGGVEALTQVLPALRPACGVAVMVVVHLPRERPSLLVDIFGPKCRLTVCEAQDKQPLEPSVIYFAPPDYHLLVDAGPQLALSSDEMVHYSRPAIDVLFESAVDVYGAELCGVVLSGSNQDGAAGLAAVARAGGLTVVQRPEEAVAQAMPASALRAAPGSLVLELREVAALLAELEGGVLAARSRA